MRKMKILAWASVSHFFIDFLCAWLITQNENPCLGVCQPFLY